MNSLQKSIVGSAMPIIAFWAFTAAAAMAADVVHNQENEKAPYASSVVVPPGYATYYISGSPGHGTDTAS